MVIYHEVIASTQHADRTGPPAGTARFNTVLSLGASPSATEIDVISPARIRCLKTSLKASQHTRLLTRAV